MNLKAIFSALVLSGLAVAMPTYTYISGDCMASYPSGLVEKVDVGNCRYNPTYYFQGGNCLASYQSGLVETVDINFCRNFTPDEVSHVRYENDVCWLYDSEGHKTQVDLKQCRGPGVEYKEYAGSCWAEYTSGYREDMPIEFCRP